jgi:phenylpyruvate tautomerase PptA (4-oxalocrotonate tautomerase family)
VQAKDGKIPASAVNTTSSGSTLQRGVHVVDLHRTHRARPCVGCKCRLFSARWGRPFAVRGCLSLRFNGGREISRAGMGRITGGAEGPLVLNERQTLALSFDTCRWRSLPLLWMPRYRLAIPAGNRAFHSGDIMPLVRIDLRKGKSAAQHQAIGDVIYESLLSVGVPKDDRFQLIHEHDAGTFLYDKTYLGIERTDELVIIQITWNEGRTVEQKKALFKAISEGLVQKVRLRPEDVFIGLIEVKKENWSFGNGIAQYAP